MRLIFSRKGVDSASGGTTSPIFPDQTMFSLPIPDKQSPIRYEDIAWNNRNVGALVSELTRGRILATYRAHLDPDLVESSVPRDPQWKPIFGQTSASQSHLRNAGVAEGDLFLFYGLFREVLEQEGRVRWVTKSAARHVLWGWLQIGDIVHIDECEAGTLSWARYHPHFHRGTESNNTLYISRTHLELPGIALPDLPGAGVFSLFSPSLQLSAQGSALASIWSLPPWFYPSEGRTPLTYHGDLDRWSRTESVTTLRSVGRGQEFVLDCNEYPEATAWCHILLGSSGRGPRGEALPNAIGAQHPSERIPRQQCN